MPPTATLLLWPLLVSVPALLIRRFRPWAHLLSAIALAMEAYGALHLPQDGGFVLLGSGMQLMEPGRLALAFVAAASAVLAVVDAVYSRRSATGPGLLWLTAVAGLALSAGALPQAPLILWLAVPLATLTFQPASRTSNTGILRALALTPLSLILFEVAAVLISQTPLLDPTLTPPWSLVATLVTLGAAAWLSLFPFYAWAPGIARGGHPEAAAWVLGIFQPLVLFLFARVMTVYPDLAPFLAAEPLAPILALATVVAGAVFAAAARRPGHLWGYSSILATGWLFAGFLLGAGAKAPAYWAGVLGYAVSTIVTAAGMAAVESSGDGTRLSDWTGIAYRRSAGVALLLVGGLSLCGLPLSVGLWAYNPNLPAALGLPEAATIAFRLAPLLAAFGWWRLLWTALQRPSQMHPAQSRLQAAVTYTFVALAAAAFVWSGVWLRLGEALVSAFGG